MVIMSLAVLPNQKG